MKILQVTPCFPPYQIGGTDHLSYLLSAGLTQKKNVKVYVFSGGLPQYSPNATQRETFQNINIERVYSSSGDFLESKIPNVEISTYKNPYYERLFENFLKEVKPDIVHFQHTIKLSSSLIPIAQKYAKKTIVSLQDFWYFCPRIHLLRLDGTVCGGAEFGFNCFYCRHKKDDADKKRTLVSEKVYKAISFRVPLTIKRYIKDMLRKKKHLRTEREYSKVLPFIIRYYYVMETFKSVDWILSPSQFLKTSYVNIGGINLSKIKVIPLGIVPFKIDKKISSPRKPIRFGFAGPAKRHKGSHLLIEVFEKIPEEEATLVIWGRGWERLSKDSRYSKNILFKGEYSHKNIDKVFSSFDVLIIPSIWGETFSFIAHEAFWVKIPVVACDIGVFSDIIKNGKNGLLFKTNYADSLYNCIKRIIEKPELIDKFSQNIKKPKTADEYVDEIYHFYKKILKK